jgi:uncharacterized membrane protein (DUF485 family)
MVEKKMKITYEIKNIKEFKSLPLICKVGFLLFYIGVILFIGCFVMDFMEINYLKQVNENIPFYCIGLSIIGFMITILFDKESKKRTKVGRLNK